VINTLRHLLISGTLIISLLSCANMPMRADLVSPDPDRGEDPKLSEGYQIGPEDVIEVLVWRNEALSKTVTVRPDGKISLPLIGDIQAAGLTPNQVQEEIGAKLKDYYKDLPPISVIVQQANSYVIYILGEVKNPAQYVVKRGTTFLQAITLAGGFTPFASKNNILVLRRDNKSNNELSIRIRYKDVVSGNHTGSNIILKPGDTIVIP
jgi:polysaccharide biosynthesis/export protein